MTPAKCLGDNLSPNEIGICLCDRTSFRTPRGYTKIEVIVCSTCAISRPLASIKSKYIVNSSQINTSDIILRTQKLRRSLCIEEKHGFLLANEGFSFYRAFTMCFSLKSRQDIFVSIAKPQLEAAVNFVRCEVSA